MHTDAHLSMPSHRYTHAYTSIRAYTRRWAADNRRWSRRCVCVRVCVRI